MLFTDEAKAIRVTLKAAHPGVKFSVRSGTGTSCYVHVTWLAGPAENVVRATLAPVRAQLGYAISGILYHPLGPSGPRS